MLVVCDACQKQINLPDEKVPPRAFAFTCPNCKNKIKVDPTQQSGAIPTVAPTPAEVPQPEPVPEAPAGNEMSFGSMDDGSSAVVPPPDMATPSAAPVAPAAAAPSVTPASGDGLPALRPHEETLMAGMSPLALILEIGVPNDPTLSTDLAKVGFQEFRTVESVDEVMTTIDEAEAGLLLIRVQKASAPPFEPITPLERLAAEVRRNLFVVLMADNVTSLDGQVAFLLQVNCLIANKDRARLPALLRRAILNDLKLYQHYAVESVG